MWKEPLLVDFAFSPSHSSMRSFPVLSACAAQSSGVAIAMSVATVPMRSVHNMTRKTSIDIGSCESLKDLPGGPGVFRLERHCGFCGRLGADCCTVGWVSIAHFGIWGSFLPWAPVGQGPNHFLLAGHRGERPWGEHLPGGPGALAGTGTEGGGGRMGTLYRLLGAGGRLFRRLRRKSGRNVQLLKCGRNSQQLLLSLATVCLAGIEGPASEQGMAMI